MGVPIMLAEFLIGRKTQRNPVGAFSTLRRESPWIITGWLGVLSGFVILSYYAVVGGWVLHYIYLAAVDAFAGQSEAQITSLFAELSGNSLLQVFWLLIFMLLTVVLVARGVSKGIELGNKIMMPLLFALLIGLLVYALQTPGAASGLGFLLEPQWEKLGPSAVLEALGQALFSLSLGMGAMITYGSYLSRNTNLVHSALWVAAGDTLVAVLAGFVVFPLVFSFGLEPSSGPGLILRTLPIAFAQLPAGQLVALAFFVLLTFAALTSSISLLEVVCAYFVDERRWTRAKASWIMGTIIFLLGIPSAATGRFLSIMDGVATNYLLPIGALLVAVFTGWVLTHKERADEFSAGEIAPVYFRGWSFLIRFISPLAMVLIFLHQLGLF
jgi:NSS family neurotransmitter:Na+ symporter